MMNVIVTSFREIAGLIEDFFPYTLIGCSIYHLVVLLLRFLRCNAWKSAIRMLKNEVLLLLLDLVLYVLMTSVWAFATVVLDISLVKEQVIDVQLIYLNAIILVFEIVILVVEDYRNRNHK